MIRALLILSLLLPRCAQAQSDRVDSCIAAQMEYRHIPGLALAVVRDGVPVKVRGYGLANVEHDVPVTPQTVFQSASLGKQFTAMLVMWLVERKVIELDRPISDYFQNSPPSWRDITVRHLLTHTSGIPDYSEDSTGIHVNLRSDYTEDQLLEMAKQAPLDFRPGERWSYCNTGYDLLGFLIHKVTGRFYGDLLKECLFQPLHMETARVISEADIVLHRAAGYRLEEGEWKNQEWVAPSLNTTADGSLYLSIRGMVNWAAALDSGKIVSRKGFDEIWTPVRLNDGSTCPYGFGWFLTPINGKRAISHEGDWQGFNTYIVRFPDDKLTVIVLVNLSPANPAQIAQEVAGIYDPGLASLIPAAILDSQPRITGIVRQLFAEPEAVTLDTAAFTLDFRRTVSTIRKAALDFRRRFGPVLSITLVGGPEKGDPHSLEYRIRYKVGSLIATITLSATEEISSISSLLE